MNGAQLSGLDYIKGLNNVMNYQFETYSISPAFPKEVAELTEDKLSVEPCLKRKDFRGEKALTIDCEDCKDMDDAVCVLKTSNGFRLSVHIADVASYVPLGSKLDLIANDRATSMYFPNYTIPMLPSILSNECCSLNPGVSRNTLSVIINLDNNGKVKKYEITKGIIRSRVKGVYSEVNQILAGSQNKHLKNKYKGVFDELFEMQKLYKLLRSDRIKRGATIEDSDKPKIRITKNNISVIPQKEGVAENMIEEFMILANNVVAEYLYENDLPAIFRIQEEKNHLAAYQPVKLQHAELALECYSHFTSPIRRVADLKIHQIITMHLNGLTNNAIHEEFDEALLEVCERATKRSRTASQVQEKCERYCYREYFRMHSEQRYTGRIVGYNKKNRPLIEIDGYNIKAVGASFIAGNIGDKVTFRIKIFDNNNDITVQSLHRLVA